LITTTTYLLTYLQINCFTGENEHMYIDSASIICYAQTSTITVKLGLLPIVD